MLPSTVQKLRLNDAVMTYYCCTSAFALKQEKEISVLIHTVSTGSVESAVLLITAAELVANQVRAACRRFSCDGGCWYASTVLCSAIYRSVIWP